MDTRWNKKSKIYVAVKIVLWALFLGAAMAALSYLVTLAARASNVEDYYKSDAGFRRDLTFAVQSLEQGIQENKIKNYVTSALVYAQTKDGKAYENEWVFDGQVLTGTQLKLHFAKKEEAQAADEGAQPAVPEASSAASAAESAALQEASSAVQSDASGVQTAASSSQPASESAVQTAEQELVQEELSVQSVNVEPAILFDSGITMELRGDTFIWHNLDHLGYLGSEWEMVYKQKLEQDIRNLLADSQVKFEHLIVYFPQEALAVNSSDYYQQMQDGLIEECLVPFGTACVIVAISGLALLVYAGKRADGSLRLFWIDRIPTEFYAAALFITGFAIPVAILQNLFSSFERFMSYGNLMTFVYAMLYLDGLCIFALMLSLVRKLKGKCFFKGSVTYRLLRGFRFFLDGDFLFRGKRYCIRNAYRIWWVAIVCGAAFIVLGLFGFYNSTAGMMLILLALAFFGTAYLFNRHYHDMKDLDVLLRQIEVVSEHGEVEVFLPEQSPLKEYEERLTRLNENINENVKQRMAAERMKLDLITNVSHDLKTPLTSIIGYVDLLNKLELSGEAGDYVKILQKKADRLSDTVSDLFTLAKSTSGSDELHLEALDLVTAVNQVLADFSDRIEAAKMPIKTTMPKEAWVLADSARIYRVLQNLLDNALRYSLKGTRIFLNVSQEQQSVSLTVLNTAGYEMDFSAQEIVQRFVRGDKSRTQEGSGLGLSIAESFMSNFGGKMQVQVEGDTFRVICSFQSAEAPPQRNEDTESEPV